MNPILYNNNNNNNNNNNSSLHNSNGSSSSSFSSSTTTASSAAAAKVTAAVAAAAAALLQLQVPSSTTTSLSPSLVTRQYNFRFLLLWMVLFMALRQTWLFSSCDHSSWLPPPSDVMVSTEKTAATAAEAAAEMVAAEAAAAVTTSSTTSASSSAWSVEASSVSWSTATTTTMATTTKDSVKEEAFQNAMKDTLMQQQQQQQRRGQAEEEEEVNKQQHTAPETAAAQQTPQNAGELSSTSSSSSSSLCSRLLQQPAAVWWQQLVNDIWKVSQNKQQPEYTNTSAAYDILHSHHLLTTQRLRKGLVTHFHGPLQTAAWQAVWRKVQRILSKPAGNSDEVIHIAVLGGSVTAGRGCWPTSRALNNRPCAWPFRLESIINGIVGRKVVQIHNMAVGGTSTAQGNVFVQYWMYPSAIRNTGPDIIINSYSTNDALPPPDLLSTWTGAKSGNSTQTATEVVWHRTRTWLQEFVRAALSSRGVCTIPPAVVHVDDYLGHQNTDSLVGELSYHSALIQVAQWYGTTAISYAEAVRDLVYPNTAETTFSAPWISRKPPHDYRVEVHFGPDGHMTAAWVVAYGLLQLLSDACADGTLESPSQSQPVVMQSSAAAAASTTRALLQTISDNGEDDDSNNNNNNNAVVVEGQQQSDENDSGNKDLETAEDLDAWPINRTWYIPPPLNDNLAIATVSRQWKEATIQCTAEMIYEMPDSNNENSNAELENTTTTTHSGGQQSGKRRKRKQIQNPCVLTWIAAPTGIFKANQLQNFLRPYLTENNGWGVLDDMQNHGWANKLGWEPKQGTGSSFTMQVSTQLQKPVAVITILYMKSYGDKWAHSTVQVKVSSTKSIQLRHEQELLGYHDSKTSITYTERIVLPEPVPVGSDLQLTMTLVNGTTFKISGMMFCSY